MRGDRGDRRFMTELTIERLKEIIHYDPETGQFTWLIDHKRVRSGDLAGSNLHDRDGNPVYRAIMIDGHSQKSHRLAWFYMTGAWPIVLIDHRDRDGLNNRWTNLREATHSQNLQNKKRHRSNISGFKGVSPHGYRWRARIQDGKRRINLGTYATPDEAHSAYLLAAKKQFGEFARAA